MSDTGTGGVAGVEGTPAAGAGACEGTGAVDVAVPGRDSGSGDAESVPATASGSDRPMRIVAARERTKGILTV